MNTNFRFLCAAITAILLSLAPALPAWAANEVNFSVSPILSANQRSGVSGYFDLIARPGETQELTIEIDNKAGEDIVVEVEAVTASTNLNGVINYTTPGENDATLPYAISDLISIGEPELTVPAHSTRRFAVMLDTPEEAYDGYLLGAIHVKKRLSEAELSSGQSILNQYSYVIAVKLAQTETPVENDFSLEGVEADLVNGRASIINYIVNPKPVLVKGMTTRVQILPQGSDTPIMERVMDKADMAPNSVFPFPLVDDAGYGVKAGNYLSVVEIDYKDRTWRFEQDFVIKAEQAAAINNSAVNLETRQTAMTQGMPRWAMVAIVAGILFFIAVIVLLVCLIRRMNAMSSVDK